jgi:23S rRNA (guanine745-N1)-methyltransferase
MPLAPLHYAAGLFGCLVRSRMTLDVASGRLQCPVCRTSLSIESRVVRCPAGHSFDVARDGYVALLGGGGVKVSGDTAEMLAARANFLGAGHYRAIADALSSVIDAPRAVLDIGAGTGYYLAHILNSHPPAMGIGFDISKAAARRIAKVHERAAAIVANAWGEWPFADAAFTHVTSVFAPRNAAEIHRVLEPGGRYIVVTPEADHLTELLSQVKLVRVDEDKADRLQQMLDGRFELESARSVRLTVDLSAAEAAEAVSMGPSGHHLDAQGRAALVASLPSRSEVTVAVKVSVYRALMTSV